MTTPRRTVWVMCVCLLVLPLAGCLAEAPSGADAAEDLSESGRASAEDAYGNESGNLTRRSTTADASIYAVCASAPDPLGPMESHTRKGRWPDVPVPEDASRLDVTIRWDTDDAWRFEVQRDEGAGEATVASSSGTSPVTMELEGEDLRGGTHDVSSCPDASPAGHARIRWNATVTYPFGAG